MMCYYLLYYIIYYVLLFFTESSGECRAEQQQRQICIAYIALQPALFMQQSHYKVTFAHPSKICDVGSLVTWWLYAKNLKVSIHCQDRQILWLRWFDWNSLMDNFVALNPGMSRPVEHSGHIRWALLSGQSLKSWLACQLTAVHWGLIVWPLRT